MWYCYPLLQINLYTQLSLLLNNTTGQKTAVCLIYVRNNVSLLYSLYSQFFTMWYNNYIVSAFASLGSGSSPFAILRCCLARKRLSLSYSLYCMTSLEKYQKRDIITHTKEVADMHGKMLSVFKISVNVFRYLKVRFKYHLHRKLTCTYKSCLQCA